MTGVFSFLDRGAEACPDRAAVVFEDQELTYHALRQASRKVANRLLSEGLERGARIATYMPNDPASFICQLGIDRTPFVWLPLNPKSAVIEIVTILDEFRAEWLFIHSAFSDYLDEIRSAVGSLKGVVCVDGAFADLSSLDAWLDGVSEEELKIPTNPLETAVLRTTGGSTGKSKGVRRTNLCQILQVMDYLAAFPYDEPPRNLILAPLSHAGGSTAIPIFERLGTQFILNSTTPADVLGFIERHRITTVFMPPTLIYNLLAFPGVRDFDLSSLKYVIYGTAPMSLQKFREAREVFGPVFAQIYGMAEASSSISIMTPREYDTAFAHRPERLASCGRGSANYRMRIVGPDGEELENGKVGEITCSSLELMDGYFENEEASNAVIRDGWLHTGDLGYKDDGGYIFIVDRLKDVIISGGFNVYPGEVEQVVFSHPAVKDCAVVGVPDDKWGEVVTAVVELKPGVTLDPADILAHCRPILGGVKSPKKAYVWDALPRSPLGKVLHKDVRSHFWTDAERAI